jgi:hypothetical protein
MLRKAREAGKSRAGTRSGKIIFGRYLRKGTVILERLASVH